MAPPAEDPLLGEVVAGNFLVLDVIGTGAMGRVYKARQLSLDKEVAIKVLHSHLTHDPNVAKRFHREARAASRLNHPNALQIIDFGQTEQGTLFIAMELVQGRDLGHVLQDEFPFSMARIAGVLGQVCSALEDAHAAGIIHRDLKPENILVTQKGGEDFVKVCDFGIAKIQDPKGDDPDAAITMAGMVCGTPEYMSPEQARGEKLDPRSDVYAVGVVLYQLLTGAVPFSAESALGVVTKHLTERPVPPRERRPDLDIHPGLEAIVLKALSKDRGSRHGSVAELKNEIETIVKLAGDAATQKPSGRILAPSPPGTLLTGDVSAAIPTRSRIPLFALLGGVVLVVVALVAWGLRGQGEVAAADPGAPATSLALSTTAFPATTAPVVDPLQTGVATAQPSLPVGEAPPDAGAPGPTTDRHARVEKGTSDRGDRAPATSAPRTASPAPAENAARVAFDEGRAAFRAGRYAEAIRKYEEAQRLGMGGAEVSRALARAHMRTGNMAQACAMYRRVLAARPSDMEASAIVSGQCGG